MAFLVVLSLFIAAGPGMLFAFFVSEQIRAWGRFSIVVIILSICIAAIFGTKWLEVSERRVWGPVLCIVIAAVVLADQVAVDRAIRNEAIVALQQDAAAIVRQVEARHAPGCAVLSLPVVPFPEYPPVVGMTDYDHLWPYMASTGLRFSYGAIKGTPAAAFQDQFATVQTEGQVDELLRSGFCGVLLDTAGYADAGAAQIVTLEALVGAPVLRSPAGRYAFASIQ